jgi:hypothetical protein
MTAFHHTYFSDMDVLPQSLICVSMDLGADGKVVKKIQEKFRTAIPQVSSVIVSLDDEGER